MSSWFTKSRRAQNPEDFETWIQGGVAPTLNAFDNGDVRAVVLIIYPIQGTIIGRSDTAGPNGKGYGELTDPMFTIDAVGGHGVAIVYPLQDGREMEKNQNGLGIGDETDPSYTLDRTGSQSVVIAFGHKDFGGDVGEVSPTLRSTSHNKSHMNGGGNAAVAIGFSHTQGIDAQPSEIAFPTLRMNGGGHAVATSVVRRLTPIECERLQGFPDDWTAGQADSHRYKQMGNAVTVNVAAWVGRAIMAANDK